MNSFTETLNHWGGNFLSFAWPMFWQSSLFIAALFAFDILFRRKIRAFVRYALWLVVLVKLCVPPTLALPTSPAWWLGKTPPPVVIKPAAHYTVTYDNSPLPEIPQSPPPVFIPPKPAMNLAASLLVISVSISSALFFWLLVRWWQITRQVHRAKISERLAALADEAQKFVGMKFKVQVKLTTNSMSPAVCGLFRPAILIPQSLAENFSDERLRAVLLHELIHLRRRDVWVNFVQALLQIFYWWHPLVWLANARIRRVREEAVDDAVMLALRDEAESYAPTLLEVAKLALNRPLASLGLVGILESRHALRQRIERLVDFRPPRKAGLTLVSLLGILAFTAVAVPMGGARDPVEINNPTFSGSNNLSQMNSNTLTLTNVAGDFKNKSKTDILVQDGKLLYEMGKLDEARVKLLAAVDLEPDDQKAIYYLNLTMKARAARATLKPLGSAIYPDWDTNHADTSLSSLAKGRQDIVAELHRVRLKNVFYDNEQLVNVIGGLANILPNHDPEKKGINFLIDQTQLPGEAPGQGAVHITIRPALANASLGDLLDAIVNGADKPIKYSVEDYGIVFSRKEQMSPPLFERTFRVDNIILIPALQKATGLQTNVSTMAKFLFNKLGVDWESPAGKSVVYNDRLGLLFVRATESDLDEIERAVQKLNFFEPQIHIKAWFVEVTRNKSGTSGFDWYLGQFNAGKNVSGNGGSSVSSNAPVSVANPLGVFPGKTASSAGSVSNSSTAVAQFTGILTDSNFRFVLHALENRPGFENLAEPEVTTTSGRQTQMRATAIITVTVVTNFALEENVTNGRSSVVPQMSKVETGPILDVVPYVLSDGYTVSLALNPSLTEFLGYDKTTNTTAAYYRSGERVDVPKISPDFRVRQAAATVNLWDNQTVVIGGLPEKDYVNGKEVFDQSKSSDKELLVFVTATIVDAAGNRVHSVDEMPFAQNGTPAQPPQSK